MSEQDKEEKSQEIQNTEQETQEIQQEDSPQQDLNNQEEKQEEKLEEKQEEKLEEKQEEQQEENQEEKQEENQEEQQEENQKEKQEENQEEKQEEKLQDVKIEEQQEESNQLKEEKQQENNQQEENNQINNNKQQEDIKQEQQQQQNQEVLQENQEEQKQQDTQIQQNNEQLENVSQEQSNVSEKQEELLDQQQTVVSRKIGCYESLREWDTKRSTFLNKHSCILQKIQSEIDQRLQISGFFITQVMNYFDCKVQQENTYAGYANPVNYQAYNETTNVQLNQLYNQHNEHLIKMQDLQALQSQKNAEFAQTIHEDILQNTLRKHNHEMKVQIDEIFHLMNVITSQIVQTSKRASHKSKKFMQIYYAQQEAKSILNTKQKKDLYKCLISYLRITDVQKQQQKNLARHTMRLFFKAKELELRQQQIIQDAIFAYQNAFEKCYGTLQEVPQFILENGNNENVEKIYNIFDILGQEYSTLIQNQLGLPQSEFNLLQVQNYLENFNIQQFEERILILKTMQIQREIAVNNFQNTTIVLTVDGFLHCQDNYDAEIQQIDNKESVEQVKTRNRYDKSSMILKLGKPVLKKKSELVYELKNKDFLMSVFEVGSRNVFKFNCEEEIEEFQRIVKEF